MVNLKSIAFMLRAKRCVFLYMKCPMKEYFNVFKNFIETINQRGHKLNSF